MIQITLEQALNIFYIVSIASIIDLSLTYYILWFDRKNNPTPKFKELNPIARYIMKKTSYGPLGLLIGAILAQTIIWGLAIIVSTYNPIHALAAGNFFLGAMFVAIWSHIDSIKQLIRHSKKNRMLEDK